MGMSEQKTRTFQKEVQKTCRMRKFPWRVDDPHWVDGDLGPGTLKVGGFAAYCMGAPGDVVKAVHQGKITDNTFKILTRKKERPNTWKKNDKDRRKELAKLRKQHREAVANRFNKPGCQDIDGEAVPNWIAKDVLKIRKRGNWKGVVVSGFRTPEYSESLCIAMCGAPMCPGRCAGRLTNHACPPTAKCQKYEGAIDVSDYATFAQECVAIGSKLHNILGAQDPVHFSYNGN